MVVVAAAQPVVVAAWCCYCYCWQMHLVGVTDCRRAAVRPNWVATERWTGEMMWAAAALEVDAERVAASHRWANAVAGVGGGDVGAGEGDVEDLTIDQCAVDVLIVANEVRPDHFQLEAGAVDDCGDCGAGGLVMGTRNAVQVVVAGWNDDWTWSGSNDGRRVLHGAGRCADAGGCAA